MPRSPAQQLAAIGLAANGHQLEDANLYSAPPPAALCQCLDPSGGDWEDIDPPQPDEWLDSMLEKTPDQSFRQFVASRPNRPDRRRRTILLQPICAAEELQGPPFPAGPWPSWSFLEAAVRRFYAPLTVRTLPAVTMEELGRPPVQSRINQYGPQYHAARVLDRLEARGIPNDAYCMLAVTMCDLYPREEWNFVYGLARLFSRVGVFSFVRHAPSQRHAPFQQFDEAWLSAQLLHRATKTMLHEIGHTFGLRHCTWYNCLMRGNNGEEVEHQKNYLHLCPVCLRKLHWSIGFDVSSQYATLLESYEPYELANECFARDVEFLRRRLAALSDLPEGATVLQDSATCPMRRATGRRSSANQPAPQVSTARPSPGNQSPVSKSTARRSPANQSPRPVSRTNHVRSTTRCGATRRMMSSPAVGGAVEGTAEQQETRTTSPTLRQGGRAAVGVQRPQQATTQSRGAGRGRG